MIDRPTAHDRFKQRSRGWIWPSVSAATVLHFVVLAFWPQMSVAETPPPEAPLVSVAIEPPLPEAPPEIRRPARPVITSDALLVDEVPMPRTTFDQWGPDLPPPPLSATRPGDDFTALVPTMVRPELINQDEVIRAMQRLYPPVLLEAGVGGRTVLTLLLDEEGRLHGAEVRQSSGHAQLDAAALRVIDVARFRPALNRDRAVAVRLQWAVDWVPGAR